MNLATGTKLGPYEIERPIGRGGMGEVYRALDSRLGRPVAIKVLTAGSDEDRLKRFENEARTVGALNHPNLLTLHDIGRHDGQPYIVTELLTGTTLRAQLKDGPLAIAEAIRIAAEVARGLAAAHDRDIVHRDIKPENLFVTQSGHLKILDFGVAKLTDDGKPSIPPPDADPALQNTALDTARTSTGMVIGTPGYMAPEQLRGDTVDPRTDVFSLGVVLYEMVAGARPFAAETSVEESYAILKLAPTPLSSKIPEQLDRLIQRCLDKRPDSRFQSASDLAFALDAIVAANKRRVSSLLSVPVLPKPGTPAASPARRWPLLVAILVVGLVGLAFWLGRTSVPEPKPEAPPAVPVVELPQYRHLTFGNAMPMRARFVPGERAVVYARSIGGTVQVFKAQIDTPTVKPVAEGQVLDISRRRELATLVGDELRRVMLDSDTAPRTAATGVLDAAWAPDADRLAIIKKTPRGSAIEFPLGHPLVERGSVLRDLRISRDGRHLAFVDAGVDAHGKVIVIDATGKQVASAGPFQLLGIGWRNDRELWFSSASRDPAANAIHALDIATGVDRIELYMPELTNLDDVDGDGRVLFRPQLMQIRQFVMRGDEAAREVSWYDGTVIQGVSPDGADLAFVEGMETGALDGVLAAYVRKRDAPPMQIGHASTIALVPDGKSAVGPIAEDKELQRLPIRPGPQKPLERGPIVKIDLHDEIEIAWKVPRIAFRAAAAGKPLQLWVQDLAPDDARDAAIGPPRVVGDEPAPIGRHPIAPDGETIAMAAPHGIRLVSVSGKPARELAADPGSEPIGFTQDGTALLVVSGGGAIRVVSRIDLMTGRRTPRARLTLPQDSGGYFTIRMSADGSTLAYSAATRQWDLYMLERTR